MNKTHPTLIAALLGVSLWGLNAMAVHVGDVAPVPIPAAGWLLGSGLLGLVGVARRKVV